MNPPELYNKEPKKVEIDDLKHEVFEARHACNQLESSQMESVLDLERKIRRLENDLEIANFNFDQLSRDRAAGISQIDHKKILNSVHNQYEEKMKAKEVEVLEEKILTAKQEEKVTDLHAQIEVMFHQRFTLCFDCSGMGFFYDAKSPDLAIGIP